MLIWGVKIPAGVFTVFCLFDVMLLAFDFCFKRQQTSRSLPPSPPSRSGAPLSWSGSVAGSFPRAWRGNRHVTLCLTVLLSLPHEHVCVSRSVPSSSVLRIATARGYRVLTRASRCKCSPLSAHSVPTAALCGRRVPITPACGKEARGDSTSSFRSQSQSAAGPEPEPRNTVQSPSSQPLPHEAVQQLHPHAGGQAPLKWPWAACWFCCVPLSLQNFITSPASQVDTP